MSSASRMPPTSSDAARDDAGPDARDARDAHGAHDHNGDALADAKVQRDGKAPVALRISTELIPVPRRESLNLSPVRVLTHKTSSGSLWPSRTPSLRSAIANSIGSAGGSSSVIPSPVIAAMGDVTPLPSPLLASGSPGPWNQLSPGSPGVSGSGSGEAPKRRVLYAALDADAAPKSLEQAPAKTRSFSEYVPDAVAAPRRPVTVSGSHAKPEAQMRREPNFAESRGLTPTVTQPPSKSSKDPDKAELFDARARGDGKKRRWRPLGLLGQGTFSRVMLATSAPEGPPTPGAGGGRRRRLVAVKVCEHGPRGGVSEERVEMSLKRELEIMLSIHHPSLVNLKAWSIQPTRAILVLSYSPGGDLFEVATAHRALLTPALLRRMFAELVGAVRYLHERRIVHRDIKLENVLVNLGAAELAAATQAEAGDWAEAFPHSLVTLTDLGLSRRIADEEKLETRYGSDDYAAPEVIMGQPYDGRATDAWSLGVLLYALLEARLPFDPHPGMSDAHRMRSRTSHRIARVEWRWVEYAGDEGEHEADVAKFERRGLAGAMRVVEGLLKRARSRWGVDRVAAEPWVRDAIRVAGGLQFWDEDEGEEVRA